MPRMVVDSNPWRRKRSSATSRIWALVASDFLIGFMGNEQVQKQLEGRPAICQEIFEPVQIRPRWLCRCRRPDLAWRIIAEALIEYRLLLESRLIVSRLPELL